MKKIGCVLSICVVLLIWASTPLYSAVVKKIIGVNAECDKALAGCFPFPTSGATICTNVLNQATCPRVFHPSWTNPNRLWGVSGTNAAACVTSIDLGLTWVACTTQAFTQIQQNVAETSDGTIVAVASDAGTCTIKTSIDGTVTWSTVFTSPAVQCPVGATDAQTLYCHQSSGQCDFGAASGGVRTYRSLDNGATWAVTTHVGTPSIAFGIEMSSPAIGAFGGSLTTGTNAVYSSAATFVTSLAWPGSAAAYLGSYPLMFGASPQYINGNGSAVWARTDADGVVQQTFTPTGAVGIGAVTNPGLRATLWGGSQYYIVGPTATGMVVWITTNNFVESILVYDPAGSPGTSSSRYTMYKLGGKILISANDGGSAGWFFRIS